MLEFMLISFMASEFMFDLLLPAADCKFWDEDGMGME